MTVLLVGCGPGGFMRWLLAVVIPVSASAVPVQLVHQGRLLQVSGAPAEDPLAVVVGVYADASTPTALWSESTSIDPDGGYYTVTLGQQTVANPLQDSVFDGSPRYVGLTVGGNPLGPRQLLSTVPDAVHARSVSGGEVRISDTAAACGASNRGALKYDGSLWLCGPLDWTRVRVGSSVEATGGVVTDTVIGGVTYRLHTFTTVGNHTFQVGYGGSVDVLVVGGGGGGGGDLGGGGGGGGVRHLQAVNMVPGSYTVTVGAGGTGGGTSRNVNTVGGDGGPSVFWTYTANGGGGAGSYGNGNGSFQNGRAGASGGGGGAGDTTSTGVGGTGTSGQGSNGGSAYGAHPYNGGGGGGAGAAGAAATVSQGGAGGDGVAVAITGTSTFYGGGGGGSWYGLNGNGSSRRPGGQGGGGAGGYGVGASGSTASGLPGTANTGGGGGGGSWTGGQPPGTGGGGSGLVIVRYPLL
jgi:hypothetical protein